MYFNFLILKMNLSCSTLSLVLLVVLMSLLRAAIAQTTKSPITVPYIAIIGGGIGGSTCSLYLSRLFGKDNVQIDIYERHKVGGRTGVVELGKSNYEAGASIIHGRNRHLVDIAKEFGLDHRTNVIGGKLGIYDGKSFVFRESDFEWLTILKLMWRYGRNVVHWETFINEMLNKFDRIYKHQDDGYAFTSVQNLLMSMDTSFVNLTRITVAEFLEDLGFGKLFVDEMVAAVTRVNYGQTPSLSAFVGSVALAAAQGSLWSVKGGNYLLAEAALRASKAHLFRTKADTITLKDGRYMVSSTYIDKNNNEDTRDKWYDIVIVAAPQTEDLASVKFVGFPHLHSKFPGRYHRTVATFVQGKVNCSYFGLGNNNDVGDIINIDTELNVNSLSVNSPVMDKVTSSDSECHVFKVFSQKPLSDVELKSMFSHIEETKVVDWLAYPHYVPPETLGFFQLHDRLYYTSGIEWIASAMEMSAIAARNVALLAHNQWLDYNDMVDAPDTMKRGNGDNGHGEL